MATWNERQQLAKSINNRLKSQGCEPPIRTGSKELLDGDLEDFLNWVEEAAPEGWAEWPPWAREWHRQRKATRGRGYVRHFRDFTPRLAELKKARKLTVNALLMFLVYRDSANDSTGANKLGLGPGETCIGGKAMAKRSGVPVSRVSEGNKVLQEAGLVVYVRRLWERGPYVRRVDMGWERPDDWIVRQAYR